MIVLLADFMFLYSLVVIAVCAIFLCVFGDGLEGRVVIDGIAPEVLQASVAWVCILFMITFLFSLAAKLIIGTAAFLIGFLA